MIMRVNRTYMRQMRMYRRIVKRLDGTTLSNETFLCVVVALLFVVGIFFYG